MRAGWLVLAAASVIVSGCASIGSEREPVVLGAIYNLTGAQADLDVPSSRGARLAVEQANQAGGVLERPVRLELSNGQSDPETAAEAARALLARVPETTALFGVSDSDMARAVGQAAAASDRVFLTSGATSPRLPAEVPEYLFLAAFGDNVQAAAGAEWARRALGVRTAAILYDTRHAYTRLLPGYFQTRFEQVGGTVVLKAGFDGDDLRPALRRVGNPDLVFLATETPADALNGIQQVRAAGIQVPILGGDGYDSADLWRDHPEIEGVYFTTHVYLGEDNPNPAVVAFRNAYRASFDGAEPDAFAALGHDAAGLLFAAVDRAASTDPAAIREALARTEGFQGVTGTISYLDGSRIPTKPVSILEVSGGELALVEEVTPERVPPP